MGQENTGARAASADELLGVWGLEVKTPFGQQPATLTLRRAEDGAASGDIDSKLGRVELLSVELAADRFDATATHQFQGKGYDARVSAEVSGGQMSGTIKVNLPIAPPLKFTGTKK